MLGVHWAVQRPGLREIGWKACLLLSTKCLTEQFGFFAKGKKVVDNIPVGCCWATGLSKTWSRLLLKVSSRISFHQKVPPDPCSWLVSRVAKFTKLNRSIRLSYRLQLSHRNVYQAKRSSYKQLELHPKVHIIVYVFKDSGEVAPKTMEAREAWRQTAAWPDRSSKFKSYTAEIIDGVDSTHRLDPPSRRAATRVLESPICGTPTKGRDQQKKEFQRIGYPKQWGKRAGSSSP